jgi:hypothetical protein
MRFCESFVGGRGGVTAVAVAMAVTGGDGDGDGDGDFDRCGKKGEVGLSKKSGESSYGFTAERSEAHQKRIPKNFEREWNLALGRTSSVKARVV